VIIALALVSFVLVASAVVWRRSVGIAQAREITQLAKRRTQLVSERAALQSGVRMAASRGRIGPVAEQRLGMHVPTDTQVVLLPRRGMPPAAPAAPAPATTPAPAH
jgi:cell division protein FtsL